MQKVLPRELRVYGTASPALAALLRGVLSCMERLDLRRHPRHLYQPSAKRVEVVDVPALSPGEVQNRIASSDPGRPIAERKG